MNLRRKLMLTNKTLYSNMLHTQTQFSGYYLIRIMKISQQSEGRAIKQIRISSASLNTNYQRFAFRSGKPDGYKSFI